MKYYKKKRKKPKLIENEHDLFMVFILIILAGSIIIAYKEIFIIIFTDTRLL